MDVLDKLVVRDKAEQDNTPAPPAGEDLRPTPPRRQPRRRRPKFDSY